MSYDPTPVRAHVLYGPEVRRRLPLSHVHTHIKSKAGSRGAPHGTVLITHRAATGTPG